MDEISLLHILSGEFDDKLASIKNSLILRDAKFPEAPQKIKIAIGMRRVGKSYFIYQHILKLMAEGVSRNNILYINFEDDRLPLNEIKLAKFVDAFYSLNPQNHEEKCYLFFDEIQNVENWPIVIRRLQDSKQVEIYLTGSSAKMLSKEIATNLRGRSLSVEIWPYSFSEYMRAKNITIDKTWFDNKTRDRLTKIFNQYLSSGGFPEIISYDDNVRQQTLQEYLDLVIYRDIIERHNIKNPSLIKYMILSMIHNVSKPFSINKFFNDVKSQHYKIGKDMLYEYADYIEDSYLAFPVSLYDKSIRKIQVNPKKIYAIDPGFTRAMTLDYENDLGRLFENIIYLEFRRLGYEINYYLTSERYEIDFVVQSKRGHTKIFQVAMDLQDKRTYEREHRALESAMRELKMDGEIITLDSFLNKGLSQIDVS